MLYDPEDDDNGEEFELERYVYIVVGKVPPRILYCQGYFEFDRRVVPYLLKKKIIVDKHDFLRKLADFMLTDVPFFCRNYKITYDRDFEEFTREIEVNYPNKILDIIHLFDAENDQRF